MDSTAPAGATTADGVALRQSRSVAWAWVLRRHAHLQPDAVAITFEDRSITFAELDERIARTAAVLSGLGVGGGDRVAILCGNRPELLEALGGANRLGAIGVPINFRLVAREVAYHLSDSGAAVLVADPERADVAREALAELGGQGGSTPELVVLGEEWEAVLAGADPASWTPDEAAMLGWLADSPALIVYTSGTTGRPKGAVLTHLNLFCQTMTQVRESPTSPCSARARCRPSPVPSKAMTPCARSARWAPRWRPSTPASSTRRWSTWPRVMSARSCTAGRR